jgi:o-succinylbenzoate---CoA ligase
LIPADWLRASAQANPQALALSCGERQVTYKELDRLVTSLAGYLRAKGIRPGQRVGVLLPNSLTYAALIHALMRLGATLVPLNSRLTSNELAWQIEQAAANWLCHNPQTAAAPTLTEAGCRPIVVDETAFTYKPQAYIDYAQFGPEQLQAILFTSGTAGRPKGAQITVGNHFFSAMASAYRLGLQPDDYWLSCLPLYHVGGLAVILRSCLYGTAVDLHPRFDLASINQSLDQKPISLISLVPTMLHRLLASRDHWPASLRLILLGGAAVEPELMAQANSLPRRARTSVQISEESGHWRHQPEPATTESFLMEAAATEAAATGSAGGYGQGAPLVAPTYGLTEAASQVATMRPVDAARKPGSVGKPLLFTQVQIVDDQQRPLPPGEIGEIMVSGPTITPGYYPTPSLTLQPGFWPTGDLGYLDQDGDLWVMQRRSDLIVSGGENVYPAEVEAALREHPAVEAVCVVGLPHPEWGQQVAAVVVTNGSLTAEELLAHSRKRLAGYKLPRLIRFAPELPQTASGKIARQVVQEWLGTD